MHLLRAFAFLFVLISGTAPPAAARVDALAELDACSMRLEPDIDVGFERIAARCPGLAADLQASDWAAWLPEGWSTADNNLSAPSLAALHKLVVRERGMRRSKPRLDAGELRSILANLSAPDQEPHGWWARFQSWLRSVLARSERDPEASGLGRLIGRLSLSQALLEVVSYGTLLFVVLLAGFIVVNEWRAAGMRKRWPRAPARQPAAATGAAQPLNMGDIERAALSERPRMLLALIAERLTAARRLPATAALTARELARSAQLADVEDQERLAAVAIASERLRFSDEVPPPASLDAVLQRGRELLERLNAAEARA
jgi:hypothetical protein